MGLLNSWSPDHYVDADAFVRATEAVWFSNWRIRRTRMRMNWNAVEVRGGPPSRTKRGKDAATRF